MSEMAFRNMAISYRSKAEQQSEPVKGRYQRIQQPCALHEVKTSCRAGGGGQWSVFITPISDQLASPVSVHVLSTVYR